VRERPIVLFEHGIGFSFGGKHTSYAGGGGFRRLVTLFVEPNEYPARRNMQAHGPDVNQVIVGCAKMDAWHVKPPKPRSDPPVVAISFHWDCRICPETRSAWEHFRSALPELASEFRMIGHGHPRILEALAPEYERLGIPVVWDFEEVMETADVYINDASSTLYEFASLDRPVVVLNAPWYRRDQNHGLRFWEHADVGVQCDDPDYLADAVREALADSGAQQVKRHKATDAAFKYHDGTSARRAADAIMNMVQPVVATQSPFRAAARPPKRKPQAVALVAPMGVLYIAFGAKARVGALKSAASLRGVGCTLPVAVVGDAPIAGFQYIPWRGPSPFKPSARDGFRFRAGLVKPALYDLSPFERTLYVDADTEFMRDPTPGFAYLDTCDIAIATHSSRVSDQRQKRGDAETDATLAMAGDDNFWNSGVIFWKRSDAVKALFGRWATEWARFSGWDEQLALMRASVGANVHRLDGGWNCPSRKAATYIFHEYGKGAVR
jgi:hypothetical protein